MNTGPGDRSAVVAVTSVPPPRSQQVAGRRRGYLLVQATRVVLFLLAVAAPLPLPARVGLLVVCGVLSIVSVTAANTPDRAPACPVIAAPSGGRALPAGRR